MLALSESTEILRYVYFIIYKNEVGLLLALSIKVPIFTRKLLIHKAFGLKRLTQIIAVYTLADLPARIIFVPVLYIILTRWTPLFHQS